MTDASEMEQIATRAAALAVRTTLLSIGIDVDEPLEAQKDFVVLREVGKLVMDAEFRKDLESARAWRLAVEQIKKKGLATAVGIVVTGLLGLLWIGFGQYLHLPSPPTP